MSIVVLEHHLDSELNMFRLIIGESTERAVPMLDESGNALVDDSGYPITEQVTDVTPLEDFAWDADDESWSGLSLDEVADKQFQLVFDTLKERQVQEQAPNPDPTPAPEQLPGVGRIFDL